MAVMDVAHCPLTGSARKARAAAPTRKRRRRRRGREDEGIVDVKWGGGRYRRDAAYIFHVCARAVARLTPASGAHGVMPSPILSVI